MKQEQEIEKFFESLQEKYKFYTNYYGEDFKAAHGLPVSELATKDAFEDIEIKFDNECVKNMKGIFMKYLKLEIEPYIVDIVPYNINSDKKIDGYRMKFDIVDYNNPDRRKVYQIELVAYHKDQKIVLALGMVRVLSKINKKLVLQLASAEAKKNKVMQVIPSLDCTMISDKTSASILHFEEHTRLDKKVTTGTQVANNLSEYKGVRMVELIIKDSVEKTFIDFCQKVHPDTKVTVTRLLYSKNLGGYKNKDELFLRQIIDKNETEIINLRQMRSKNDIEGYLRTVTNLVLDKTKGELEGHWNITEIQLDPKSLSQSQFGKRYEIYNDMIKLDVIFSCEVDFAVSVDQKLKLEAKIKYILRGITIRLLSRKDFDYWLKNTKFLNRPLTV